MLNLHACAPPHTPTVLPCHTSTHRVQLKAVLMAVYFGADHFVWAHQIGLTNDKKAGEQWGKISVYAWMFGSICTVLAESWQIALLSVTRKEVCMRLLTGHLITPRACFPSPLSLSHLRTHQPLSPSHAHACAHAHTCIHHMFTHHLLTHTHRVRVRRTT